jgi:hypothetical protein
MTLIRTLLMEYHERLNRQNYGEWITDTNEIIPVKNQYGHLTVLINKAKAENTYPTHLTDPEEIEDFLYDKAFKNNWIRVTHTIPSEVGFEGLRRAFKRIVSIIRATAAQSDVDLIITDFYGGSFENFRLPEHRQELIKFLNLL